MSKKFSEEEFQEFVVEQFGKLTTEITEVRGEIASVCVEMQTGFREVRSEIEEIKGILEPLVTAFDVDAEKIVEHDRRIGRLEEHVGISKHA